MLGICMYVHMYASMHACMHTHIDAHITCMYVRNRYVCIDLHSTCVLNSGLHLHYTTQYYIACMHACMHGWMDGWMDGRRDGGMEGWRDGGMDGCMRACMHVWIQVERCGWRRKRFIACVLYYWAPTTQTEVSSQGCLLACSTEETGGKETAQEQRI